MAYKYHCTFCGKELDQTNVLFDMQDLLLESKDKRFAHLKFRLKQDELEKMMSGQPDADGYIAFQLTFEHTMKIIANSNNLNNPEIARLSLDELRAYIDFENKKLEEGPKKKKKTGASSMFTRIDVNGDKPEETPEEENPEFVEPEAIKAIKASVVAAMNDTLMELNVLNELQMLSSAFMQDGERHLRLSPLREKDDNQREVLIGCAMIHPISQIKDLSKKRICPDCGTDIGEYAFRAEHNSVVFVGSAAAGKTSTILALTHYAQDHLGTGISSIWNGFSRSEHIAEIKPVNPSEELKRDMDNYLVGLAPYRTPKDAREKAYSSTFWIRSKEGKHSLLTLIDLPGELFDPAKTEENRRDLMNRYSVSMSCHAYIVCFDTKNAAAVSESERTGIVNDELPDDADKKKKSMGDIIRESSEQALMIQELRMQEKRTETFAPMMILYTKCRELEEEDPNAKQPQQKPHGVEALYRFFREKKAINDNGIYASVSETFRKSEKLSRAYFSMLRCSPFGYAAPSLRDQEQYEADKKTPTLTEKERKALKEKVEGRRKPTPHHINDLMLWILDITGCTSMDADYAPVFNSDEGKKEMRDYYVSRIQYPTQKPGKLTAENRKDQKQSILGSKTRFVADEVNEAMARCVLFENPSETDRRVVEDIGEGWTAWVMRKWEELTGRS